MRLFEIRSIFGRSKINSTPALIINRRIPVSHFLGEFSFIWSIEIFSYLKKDYFKNILIFSYDYLINSLKIVFIITLGSVFLSCPCSMWANMDLCIFLSLVAPINRSLLTVLIQKCSLSSCVAAPCQYAFDISCECECLLVFFTHYVLQKSQRYHSDF